MCITFAAFKVFVNIKNVFHEFSDARTRIQKCLMQVQKLFLKYILTR